MKEHTKPLSTMALPQYALSNDFMERFLDAIHTPGKEIERSPNDQRIKLVDGSELDADALTYFTQNKPTLEAEFLSDLTETIGKDKAIEFCDVIATYWVDGRAKRQSLPVQQLKASVYSYLNCILRGRISMSEIVVMANPIAALPSFSDKQVAKILEVNDRLLLKHIGNWLDQHPDSTMLSRGNVFFRRGLGLSQPFVDGDIYREWDFINSYSIAISAPEKFAQMQGGLLPALVNADCDYFNGRVLFFSPFVPSMPVGQLEVGVIPNDKKDTLRAQGRHGGVYEYLLGRHPT